MAFYEAYCNASTGSNMNGGSDENTTPAWSDTNGNWNSGTGVFTVTTGDPSSASPSLVGMLANVFNDGATTPVFVGRVTAVSSTTITVSTTAKSGTAPTTSATGRSINVGGVWKGPNGTVGFPFGFVQNTMTNSSSDPPRINFKNNSNYAITATMSHSNNGLVVFQGYSSTPGDGGKAIFDGSGAGAAFNMANWQGNANFYADFIVQNSGPASSTGYGIATGASEYRNIVVNNTNNNGFSLNSAACRLISCEAYSCNKGNNSSAGGFAGSGLLIRCISHDNTTSNSSGFSISGTSFLSDCIADTNGQYGYNLNSGGGTIISRCVAYNNTSHGIYVTNTTLQTSIENCILSNNGGYGVNRQTSTATSSASVSTCAFRSNTSGETNNINTSFITGSITLTGNQFVDAANGDFDLNSTAGAGAACRDAGAGSFTQTAASYTGTLSYPDIGASQHQDAGGGSSRAASLVNSSGLVG